MRSGHRRCRSECNIPAAVVCAGSGTLVAISSRPDVQAGRVSAFNARGRAAAGASDFGANGNCTVGCGGESGARNQSRERAADTLVHSVKSLASGGVQRPPMRVVTFHTEGIALITKAHDAGTSINF